MSQIRIGLYGGAFDPVHEGHIALAEAAMHCLSLDHLIWIPTGNPSHPKHPLSPFESRVVALQAIISQDDRWSISEIENTPSKINYTSDTLDQLCTDQDVMYFTLIGADQAIQLNTWHKLDRILALSHIAVAPRDNIELPQKLPEALKALWCKDLKFEQQAGLITPITMTPISISSTQLR